MRERKAVPEDTRLRDAATLALTALTGSEYDRNTTRGAQLGDAEDALRDALRRTEERDHADS